MTIKNEAIAEYFSNINVSLIIAEYFECNKNWVFTNFYPDHNKLYFICDGEGKIIVDGKSIYPKKGQFVFLPAYKIQSLSWISDNRYKKYYCHFSAMIGNKNLFDIVKLPLFIDIPDETQKRVIKLFEKLVQAYNSKTIYNSLKAKGVLLELLGCYFENVDELKYEITKSNTIEAISNILKYVDEHIADDISVEDLAKVAYLQQNYFIKFFKKNMGMTPKKYVINRKIEVAKNLLADSNDSITKIADQVGFKNASHFSRVFSEYYGLSPKNYRKK